MTDIENTKEEKPLVTFAMLAFNQEQYIREAIEGAFAQTYAQLEIILSDDCSTDSTFTLMKSLADDYSGPHKVIINRNLKNRGIGSHLNRIMEISAGDFVVIAAGDDFSLPHRTERLVSTWLKSNRTHKSIFSNCFRMRTDGTCYGTRYFDRFESIADPASFILTNGFVFGATQGWDREVFDKFGPLFDSIVHEDRVIPLRSLLIGTVCHLNESLVRYRDGGISQGTPPDTTLARINESRATSNGRFAEDARQWIKDLATAGADTKLVNASMERAAKFNLIAELCSGNPPLKSAIKALRFGVSPADVTKEMLKSKVPISIRRTLKGY